MALKTGDVIIRRKAGVSICYAGIVLDDEVQPQDMKPMGLNEAKDFADRTIAVTHGRIHELDEHGRSGSSD